MDLAAIMVSKFGSYYSFMKVGILVSMAGTMVLAYVMARFRNVLGKNKKRTMIYLIAGTLLVALTTLPVNHKIFNLSAFWAFISIQGAMLLLGILHVFLMKKFFNFKDIGNIWPELLFSIAFCLICFAPFMMVFKYFNQPLFNHYFLGTFIFLVLPIFFIKTFELAIDMPTRVYKKWYYPLNSQVEKPKDIHLKNLLTISVQFLKTPEDKKITNFKVNAPEEMDFGKLFFFFINEYNNKHPEQTIEYIGSEGKPHGWIFYHKPRWYSLFKKFLYPNRTIFKNNVTENSTVICERVL